ncbi:MAG: hypothetical protein IIA59_02690 [Candidatus Marinimicrobia bacterium]|nr:hypothetical protein [Candidatus Neomarinimicrobiota bacterium]
MAKIIYSESRHVLLALTLTIVLSCNGSVAHEEFETYESGVYYDLNYPLVPAQDQSSLPDSILALYEIDASRLTVRMMLALGGEAAGEIELPLFLKESLTNGLIAIYLASDLAPRDSVVEIYAVHTFWSPPLYEIIVSADSSRSFMRAWGAGERLTGRSAIDDLMIEYDLYLEHYYDWPGSHAVVLKSVRPLNVTALANRFNSIAGVSYAEINGYCCDGSDITVEIIDLKWVYSFWLKWGDCPSGCISSHVWSFAVGTDGVVTFLEPSGSILP